MPVTPPTIMNTTPNTMWCTWKSPGVTLPGHQRTLARIIRTESRMNPKPATNATKKQNSGNRPVSTIFVLNQLDMPPPPAGLTFVGLLSPERMRSKPGRDVPGR